MKAVNLLPPDLRGAAKRSAKSAGAAVKHPGGSGPFFVLGALVLCVVGLAGFVLAKNSVSERKAELARVSVEHKALTQRAAQLKPYGDFQDLAQRRVETVQALASLRFDWEQALRDISHATPDNVTLTSLQGTVSAGEPGGSTNPLRGAISAPAIELKGCTRSQPVVARLMSRLKTVPGATRVTLSKADKDTQTGTAIAGGTTSTGPCGENSPPSFEMVVFFERAVAQAAAVSAPAPGAAAAAPAASPQAAASATPAATAQPASQTTGATTAP